MDYVKVFAPASVGNIGPGFDVLGMAIERLGDVVEARRIPRRTVRISEVTGDDGRLPRRAAFNTAGIAALAVLRLLKPSGGVELKIHKGIPGSGLGSSAASAVAGGFAVNQLYGAKLSRTDLVLPCAIAESKVSGGVFLDNIGASLMGGVVITHPSAKTVLPLGYIPNVMIVVATPDYRLLTKKARKILPKKIGLEQAVSNMSYACTLVAAISRRDAKMFGCAIQDGMIEPVRAGLIPGFGEVKKAALRRGALGCSISGAGASVFAVTDSPELAPGIGEAMRKAFGRHGLDSIITITRMDRQGARVMHDAL